LASGGSMGSVTSWRRSLYVISLLFFLSGASGLVYEVVWFKQFAHVWGNSALAMAAVVGSFLLGLGIGAALWGRFADRVARPLIWYGLCEGLIGILAILIPYEIHQLRRGLAAIYPFCQDRPTLFYIAQFLLTLIVVGPPCLLMGGTLPLLVKQFALLAGR